jgi:hypothetical protein
MLQCTRGSVSTDRPHYEITGETFSCILKHRQIENLIAIPFSLGGCTTDTLVGKYVPSRQQGGPVRTLLRCGKVKKEEVTTTQFPRRLIKEKAEVRQSQGSVAARLRQGDKLQTPNLIAAAFDM